VKGFLDFLAQIDVGLPQGECEGLFGFLGSN
jgi:hypothetical protein